MSGYVQGQQAAASALFRNQYSPQQMNENIQRGIEGPGAGAGGPNIMRGMGTAPMSQLQQQQQHLQQSPHLQNTIPISDPRHPGHAQYLHDRQQQIMHQQYSQQQSILQNGLQYQNGLPPTPIQRQQFSQAQQQQQQQQQLLYHQQRQQEQIQNSMAAPLRPPSVLQRSTSTSKPSPSPVAPGAATYRSSPLINHSPLPPPSNVIGAAPPMRGPPKMLRKNSVAPGPNIITQVLNNTTLAANMALLGSGPITATASAVGPALLKLNGMNESIGLAYQRGGSEDLRGVVREYFTETGIMKFSLHDNVSSQIKVFEIPCSAFPRFQHNNIMAGATCSSINPAYVREYILTAPSIQAPGQPIHVGYLLKAERASWMTQFAAGIQVEVVGTLIIHFVVVEVSNGSERSAGLRIESFEFNSRGHTELIARSLLREKKVEEVLIGAMKVEAEPASPTTKTRPVRKQTTRRKSSTKGEDEEVKPVIEKAPAVIAAEFIKGILPPSPVGNFGVTEMGMRCLEIAESVAHLQDLIHYSLDTGIGPLECLARFTAQNSRNSLPPQSPYSTNQRPTNLLQGIPLVQNYSQSQGQPSQSQSIQPPNPFPSPSLASSSQNPNTNTFYSSTGSNSPYLPEATIPSPQLNDPTRNKKRKVGNFPTGVGTPGMNGLIPRTPTPDELNLEGGGGGGGAMGGGGGSAGINSTPNGSIGINMNGGGQVLSGRGRGRGGMR